MGAAQARELRGDAGAAGSPGGVAHSQAVSRPRQHLHGLLQNLQAALPVALVRVAVEQHPVERGAQPQVVLGPCGDKAQGVGGAPPSDLPCGLGARRASGGRREKAVKSQRRGRQGPGRALDAPCCGSEGRFPAIGTQVGAFPVILTV